MNGNADWEDEMVWDVWKDDKVVASFLRHEIDIAYRWAVRVNGYVRPRQI